MMASDGEVHPKMVFFRKFAENNKNSYMTISEACEKVLIDLGGRAQLPDIYPRVLKLVTFTGATPKNSIRTEMKNHPLIFRHSPNKPKGWWELVSYQEEIASRDKRIKELEEENARLKSIKTEDAFVEKMLKETKKRFKHESERNKAVAVSQILAWAGREDASENLDEWLEGKEKPFIAVNGDYVFSKHVENEIDNIEAGGTGVNINKEKD